MYRLMKFGVVSLCIFVATLGRAHAAVDDNDVLLALQASNLDSSTVWPWVLDADAVAKNGVIKRWDVTTGLIPVQVNGNIDAEQAMSNIEAALGMTLFDRTSIAGIAAADITHGLIVSSGTSYVPPDATQEELQDGYWQGNVSSGPYEPGYPFHFVTTSGAISARLFLNLGNSVLTRPSLAVVEHEFAHAMGLSSHFEGFGNDDDTYPEDDSAMGKRAWAALSTLYHNPIGTARSEIQVFQALPVPEPSTYLMLMAGLPVVGLVIKRRKSKITS